MVGLAEQQVRWILRDRLFVLPQIHIHMYTHSSRASHLTIIRCFLKYDSLSVPVQYEYLQRSRRPLEQGEKVVVSDDPVIIDDILKKMKLHQASCLLSEWISLLPNNHRILILFSRSSCLVTSSTHLVRSFMLDKTICFVGISADAVRRAMGEICSTNVVVELGNMAATVLKKHSIKQCSCLETLAGEAGVELKQEPALAAKGDELSWNEGILSQKEVEYATHRALSIFLVAEKLFASALLMLLSSY